MPRTRVEQFLHWLDEWKFETLIMAPVLFVIFALIAMVWDPDAVAGTLAAIVFLSPFWMPVMLFVAFWTTWMHYIRFYFWFGLEHVVLQIELPPDVQKSPLAMELFMYSLWNAGGESTFIARIWKGSFRAIWSLEIASNEGQIHFYIHLRSVWREIVEARLYGQFPEAKVTLLKEDYVTRVPFNLQEYDLVGSEFGKKEADPLSIKTYVDWGLHMDPDKPEKLIDPMTYMFELMGTLGPGEYMWMQIIAKARKKDEWYGFYKKKDQYAEEAKAAINKILKEAGERTLNRYLETVETEGKKIDIAAQVASRGVALLSQPEKDRIEIVERNLGKRIFECGIRVLYIAKKENFKGINGGAIVNFFRPFDKPDYNELSVQGAGRGTLYFDYPWQDWNGWRANIEKRNQFFRYKHRAYFYVPYDQVPVMMTNEEVASLWHFPSMAVKTPALSRVPSRRSDAPTNLPTGPSAPAGLPH
jgi:hypothetical protein